MQIFIHELLKDAGAVLGSSSVGVQLGVRAVAQQDGVGAHSEDRHKYARNNVRHKADDLNKYLELILIFVKI